MSEPGNYSIRPASDSDAGRIAEVHIACWRDAYSGIVDNAFLDSLSNEEITGRIRTKYMCEGTEFVVAVSESTDEIAGYCVGGKNREPEYGCDAEVYMLYVDIAHRGNGVGKLMVNHITRKIAELGFSSLIIWTFRDNPYRRFYESLGGRGDYSGSINIGGKDIATVHFVWDDIRELINKTKSSVR